MTVQEMVSNLDLIYLTMQLVRIDQQLLLYSGLLEPQDTPVRSSVVDLANIMYTQAELLLMNFLIRFYLKSVIVFYLSIYLSIYLSSHEKLCARDQKIPTFPDNYLTFCITMANR